MAVPYRYLVGASLLLLLFLFTAPATPAIYTLSLHDALPIYCEYDHALDLDQRLVFARHLEAPLFDPERAPALPVSSWPKSRLRSEEHTSELQSRPHLVCRLLLEKKKNQRKHKSLRETTTGKA